MSDPRAALKHASGHEPQRLIALRVAMAIVDLLEIVEVDHRDRQLPSMAHRRSELSAKPLVQRPMVGQSGELVGERVGLEPSALRRCW